MYLQCLSVIFRLTLKAEMVVLFQLFYLTCIPCIFSLSVTDNIVRVITDQITALTPRQITEKIELHYRLLGLIDDNGKWVDDYFEKYSNGTPCFPR